MSLDLGPLINDRPLEAWTPYDVGADVKIRYITEDQVLDMQDRCLNTQGKVDRKKLRMMIAEEAIIDWRGFKDGKKELVCNKENIKKLLLKLTAFSNWVETMATEYTVLQRFKLAKEKKSSGHGSGPGRRSPKSTAKAVKTSRKKTK